MEIQRSTPYGILIILITVLFSCSYYQHKEDAETIRTDSLLSIYIDSIAVNPLKVVSILRDNQRNVSDSLNYYYLQQTISRCYYFGNRIDSAFLLTDEILRYIEKQPEMNNRLRKLSGDTYNSRGVFFQEMNGILLLSVCIMLLKHYCRQTFKTVCLQYIPILIWLIVISIRVIMDGQVFIIARHCSSPTLLGWAIR